MENLLALAVRLMEPQDYTDAYNRLPLRNKLIYIVGRMRLQNSLLASFLEEKTGAKCRVLESLDRIPKSKDENQSDPRLILLDCLRKNLQTCVMEFDANDAHVSARDFTALFNLSPGFGIEKRTISRGVDGFFYEHDTKESLAKGVCAIFNGELWISRKVMAQCIRTTHRKNPMSTERSPNLTPREIEILTEVSYGASNKEIADKLYVSEYTVKTHLHNIFKKIDVPNRLQATLWAAESL